MSHDPPIHVIVISAVRPEPSSAGPVILHRHLIGQPGLSVEVHGSEPEKPSASKVVRRLLGRLQSTGLKRFIEDFWVLWGGRWLDPELPVRIENPARTVVLTVAHGDCFMAAQRFARKHRLPLVSIFHDWWPDMAATHGLVKGILERRFKRLADDSAVAFCVSEGMKVALGGGTNALVLHPIPGGHAAANTRAGGESTGPFKVLYSGNLGDYGKLLGDALKESVKWPDIHLQVRGSKPPWEEDFVAKMRLTKRLFDFAPRGELEAWLETADLFLVPMEFAPAMRKRMETSFPSKLVEFAQFGKPVVVWGPDYCSAVRWARELGDGKVLVVTDPSPSHLLSALREFGLKMRVSMEDFNREGFPVPVNFTKAHIHSVFVEALTNVVEGGSSKMTPSLNEC